MNGALFLAKSLRLSWWAKNTNKTAFVSWPIFGFVGYFYARQIRNVKNLNYRKISASKWQDLGVYACILLLPFAGYIYNMSKQQDGEIRWAVVPLVALFFIGRRYAGDLHKLHDQQLSMATELDVDQDKIKELTEQVESLRSEHHEKMISTGDAMNFVTLYNSFDPEVRDALQTMAKRTQDKKVAVVRANIRKVWDRDQAANVAQAGLAKGVINYADQEKIINENV